MNESNDEELVRTLADKHVGIGGDGYYRWSKGDVLDALRECLRVTRERTLEVAAKECESARCGHVSPDDDGVKCHGVDAARIRAMQQKGTK